MEPKNCDWNDKHLFIGKTSGLLSQAFDSAPLSEKGQFRSFDVALLKVHVKSKSMKQSHSGQF